MSAAIATNRPSASDGSRFSLVKLLLGASANLVQFSVQAAKLGIQLDETQAMSRDQPICLNPGEVLVPGRLDAYAGRWLLCSRIVFQVEEIETRGFHGRIIPRKLPKAPVNFY